MIDAYSLLATRPGPTVDPSDGDVAAAIVDATDAPLCVSDATGRCVAVNDAAAQLLGASRVDLVGHPVAPVLEAAGALRTVVRRTAMPDGRTLTVATLRPEPIASASGPGAAEAEDLRSRLAPSVHALGSFIEVFNARPFGPLGHARYDDFATAITEAARVLERVISEPLDGETPHPSLAALMDERPCSLRGVVTTALRRGRRDLGVEVSGDDMSVRCDPVLLARAIDAMTGAFGDAGRSSVSATLARLVDGRVVIGIHHDEDGYPLGWARSAGILPLDGGEADAAVEIDVADARRIFEAHGGGVFVNTEEDAGISVFGVLGLGRLIGATPRRGSTGTEIRRAIYVDAKISPAAFAAIPVGAFRLTAAGQVVANVAGRAPAAGKADQGLGADIAEGPLRPLLSHELRRTIARAAEDGIRGLHEVTVEVGDQLRLLHLEVVPARHRPGECWLFLRVV